MEKKFEFTPKQWVLARDNETDRWCLCQFSHRIPDIVYPYVMCGSSLYARCIPYEGNEHLLGTTDPYVPKNSDTVPKNNDFVPKDGDFVVINERLIAISANACKYKNGGYAFKAYAQTNLTFDGNIEEDIFFEVSSYSMQESIRPATSEERDMFLSSLHNIGKQWNAEKKEIVPLYKPEEGDFAYCKIKDRNYKFVFIKKNGEYIASAYVTLDLNPEEIFINRACSKDDHLEFVRPATEEEKQLLLSKLHEFGKDWNAEKKEVVDWKWKPKEGDTYYYIDFEFKKGNFDVLDAHWGLKQIPFEELLYEKGWVFRTEAECQAMCEKLNEAIKGIK